MAAQASSPAPPPDLDEIIKIMWGTEVKEEVFQRWKQGFKFSSDEPTALIQHEGGPCAVMAPVQAHILKSIIKDYSPKTTNWNEIRQMESDRVSKLLIRALCEILSQAYAGNKYILVHMNNAEPLDQKEKPASPSTAATQESVKETQDKQEAKKNAGDHSYFHSQLRALSFECTEEVEAYYLERIDTLRETFGVLLFLYSVLCTKGIEALHCEVTDPSEPFVDSEYGYGSQSLINLMISGRAVAHVWNYDQDICGLMRRWVCSGKEKYQCKASLRTHGAEVVFARPHSSDHAAYATITKVAAKAAIQWKTRDGISTAPRKENPLQVVRRAFVDFPTAKFMQEASNLQPVVYLVRRNRIELKGVNKQCHVGFLTLLEHLRYCEVGSFLKNPINPVWVLGSETHLTVLFSFEKRLVSAETPSEVARRVFKSYDPEGNNFISSELLQDVMSSLDLVSDPEYVDIMRKKLDSENLGIILLSAFMDEFFPEDTVTIPDTFPVYHYNGLLRSCPNNKVTYQEGTAILLETNMACVLESNSMLTCLQTKWPSIELQWASGVTPSLN